MADAETPRCEAMRVALRELSGEPDGIARHVMSKCVGCRIKCGWLESAYPLAFRATPPRKTGGGRR